MRRRAAALVLCVAAAALPAAAPADAALQPPPFAFRDAALDRPAHSIDVELMAMADEAVVIAISRGGRRIGRRRAVARQGGSTIAVPVGPRTIARLRPGLHVDLRIFYSAPQPVVIRGVRLSAAPAALAARQLAEPAQ